MIKKKLVSLLFFSLVGACFLISEESIASTCSGGAVNSCSAFAFTSSQCPNYYMNSGIQCKWNGSYCSDGGVKCSPPSIPKCKGKSYGSSCPTSQTDCGTLTNDIAYVTIASGTFYCTWDAGHSPANCSDSGAQCNP